MSISAERGELGGADLLYGFFYKYATRSPGSAYASVHGLTPAALKRLLLDWDLMEGVPAVLVDAAVREHCQRADQGGSGLLSAQNFVVWVLTEVAALLPIRDAFCSVMGLRPLYNQYHAVLLGDVGFTDGARRPASGMLAWQLLKMVEQYGIGGPPEAVRQAFRGARAGLGAARGGGGGAGGAAPAVEAGGGGGRLQFAGFVRALTLIADKRMVSQDVPLFQAVSCGAPPPAADARVAVAPLPPAARAPGGGLGLDSALGGAADKEAYTCAHCGGRHARWRLRSSAKLEEHLWSVGVAPPVRQHWPYVQLINARNLRAVFHRYNALFNRGRLPPASYRLPAGAGQGAYDADGGEPCEGGAPPYGACCCLFRSLSVMELSSWLRLCGDCDTLRREVAAPASALTPASLEAAFVAAAAVAGVYHSDDSAGIHDVPVTGGASAAARLALPRDRLGAVAAAGTRAAAEHPPSRSNAAYRGPPPPAAGAPPRVDAVRQGAPRLHEVRGPTSAAAWLASARSLPYDDGGGGGAAAPPHQQHRPARLALTFPQFLEALRLVAEEAGGHPTTTPRAEAILLQLVHDIVAEGCPRPDRTTAAGTAQIMRMAAAAAAGGGGGGGGGEGYGSEASYDSLPQSRHREDEEEAAAAAAAAAGPAGGGRWVVAPAAAPPSRAGGSGTSASTSTKYSYDDFTPPESNLYTSATSSRVGRPASASRNPTGPPVASRTNSLTSASTSTKYAYDDFTPPDSNLYTSAASSRVGSRPASARPAPAQPPPPPPPGLPPPPSASSRSAVPPPPASSAAAAGRERPASAPRVRPLAGAGGGGASQASGRALPRPTEAPAAGTAQRPRPLASAPPSGSHAGASTPTSGASSVPGRTSPARTPLKGHAAIASAPTTSHLHGGSPASGPSSSPGSGSGSGTGPRSVGSVAPLRIPNRGRNGSAAAASPGKAPTPASPPPPPPPAVPRMTAGEQVVAARAAAAAVQPAGGDVGDDGSLLRVGSGLRNTVLLLGAVDGLQRTASAGARSAGSSGRDSAGGPRSPPALPQEAERRQPRAAQPPPPPAVVAQPAARPSGPPSPAPAAARAAAAAPASPAATSSAPSVHSSVASLSVAGAGSAPSGGVAATRPAARPPLPPQQHQPPPAPAPNPTPAPAPAQPRLLWTPPPEPLEHMVIPSASDAPPSQPRKGSGEEVGGRGVAGSGMSRTTSATSAAGSGGAPGSWLRYAQPTGQQRSQGSAKGDQQFFFEPK